MKSRIAILTLNRVKVNCHTSYEISTSNFNSYKRHRANTMTHTHTHTHTHTYSGHLAVRSRSFKSFKVTDFGTNRKHIYHFLLVINTNLPHILHRLRDIAFDSSKIAIFGYPSCVYPPPSHRRRGSPGTISVKFSVDVNGWPRYQTAKKNLRKFQPAE